MTRMSTGSKLILSCDPLQRDQPKRECGVIYLKSLVDKYNLRDIEIVKYSNKDILRSDFVFGYVVAMQDNYGMAVADQI
jgi:phosphate starvation-inducible protein PhoH